MVIGNIDGQREKGGRVLLVIGPQCSGKSTFVSHFLKTNSNFTTINRKKIIDKINMEVNETFLASILEKIEDITGKKVGSLHELNLLNLEKLNKEQKTLFLKFRGELINIVSSNTFDEFVMHAVFKAYYQEGKKYIEIEKNLILDESLINSERSFNMFKTCFENYPYIKRILIFNTLEDLFQKCLVRNDKFFELMQQTKSIDKAFEELKLKEIESGSSDSSYRSIKSIIANYRKFYEFNHDLSKKTSLTLQTLPRYKVAELFMKMAKAHCDANKKLKKMGYAQHEISEKIDVQAELNTLFGKSDIVFISSKIYYDYLLSFKVTNGAVIMGKRDEKKTYIKIEDIISEFEI